jgi:hypothetical protein
LVESIEVRQPELFTSYNRPLVVRIISKKFTLIQTDHGVIVGECPCTLPAAQVLLGRLQPILERFNIEPYVKVRLDEIRPVLVDDDRTIARDCSD